MHELRLIKLAKPAQRALKNAGISSMEELSRFSEKEIAGFHGIGKNALINIKKALRDHGLSFSGK